MIRKARRYEFYLPLTFNDGEPVPDELFTVVENRLLDHFSGLTTHKQESALRGIWRKQDEVYYDQVIIIGVLDFRRLGSMRFVADMKAFLLQTFDQLEI